MRSCNARRAMAHLPSGGKSAHVTHLCSADSAPSERCGRLENESEQAADIDTQRFVAVTSLTATDATSMQPAGDADPTAASACALSLAAR